MYAARRRNYHLHDTVAALAEKAAGAATGLGAAEHADDQPARLQHRLLIAAHQPAAAIDGGCRGGARAN